VFQKEKETVVENVAEDLQTRAWKEWGNDT